MTYPSTFVNYLSDSNWTYLKYYVKQIHHNVYPLTSVNYVSDSYWTNPQYRVEVTDGDEGDDDNTGTLIVGVMQKERRKKRKEGLDHLTIGFSIYKVGYILLYHPNNTTI